MRSSFCPLATLLLMALAISCDSESKSSGSDGGGAREAGLPDVGPPPRQTCTRGWASTHLQGPQVAIALVSAPHRPPTLALASGPRRLTAGTSGEDLEACVKRTGCLALAYLPDAGGSAWRRLRRRGIHRVDHVSDRYWPSTPASWSTTWTWWPSAPRARPTAPGCSSRCPLIPKPTRPATTPSSPRTSSPQSSAKRPPPGRTPSARTTSTTWSRCWWTSPRQAGGPSSSAATRSPGDPSDTASLLPGRVAEDGPRALPIFVSAQLPRVLLQDSYSAPPFPAQMRRIWA